MSHNPYKKGFDMLLADIEKHEDRNDEILKLAYSLNFLVVKQGVASLTEAHLEAFYRAAFNAGLDAAAKRYSPDDSANDWMDKIRALEKK